MSIGPEVSSTRTHRRGERTPRTQIVVIGAANRINAATLRQQFNMAVIPNREAGETS